MVEEENSGRAEMADEHRRRDRQRQTNRPADRQAEQITGKSTDEIKRNTRRPIP